MLRKVTISEFFEYSIENSSTSFIFATESIICCCGNKSRSAGNREVIPHEQN